MIQWVFKLAQVELQACSSGVAVKEEGDSDGGNVSSAALLVTLCVQSIFVQIALLRICSSNPYAYRLNLQSMLTQLSVVKDWVRQVGVQNIEYLSNRCMYGADTCSFNSTPWTLLAPPTNDVTQRHHWDWFTKTAECSLDDPVQSWWHWKVAVEVTPFISRAIPLLRSPLVPLTNYVRL